MEKKDVSLIEKFKKLETEIIKLLKENKIDFDESINEKTLKTKLKNYILNVKKIEKLFEEYEAVAEKFEGLSSAPKTSAEISEAVVGLREDKQETVIAEKVGDKIVVKRKRKIKGVQREM